MIEADEALSSWNEVRDQRDWSSLLVGNGYSQNIWAPFGYASLYDTARSDDVDQNLAPEDVVLFERLDTHNFEVVLSALSTAIAVTAALNHDVSFLQERYRSIREALVAAVHHVHLPWNRLSEERMRNISAQLTSFEFVYSTNYDLLTYWSLMIGDGATKDYFFGRKTFDISNTHVWGKCTKVLYLHGGLHLYRRPTGQTLKRRAMANQNLLDLFATDYGDAVPLFISEGTAEEKKASIYRSEYLAFALSQFAGDGGPLVVFGHSLSDSDQHLVDVLRSKPGRPIAISIKRGRLPVREQKLQHLARLPEAGLIFFDAESHPLGSAALTVEATNGT